MFFVSSQFRLLGFPRTGSAGGTTLGLAGAIPWDGGDRGSVLRLQVRRVYTATLGAPHPGWLSTVEIPP